MTGLVQRASATMVALAIGCSPSRPTSESASSAKSPTPAQATAISVDTEAAAQTTASAPGPATPSPSLSLCKLGENWDGCVDQRVELLGEKAKMVSQHPVMAMPNSKQVESYIDSEGRQVVVVSDKAIACMGKLTATGTLRSVKLDGPPGTKTSYEGYRLDDAVIVCK